MDRKNKSNVYTDPGHKVIDVLGDVLQQYVMLYSQAHTKLLSEEAEVNTNDYYWHCRGAAAVKELALYLSREYHTGDNVSIAYGEDPDNAEAIICDGHTGITATLAAEGTLVLYLEPDYARIADSMRRMMAVVAKELDDG